METSKSNEKYIICTMYNKIRIDTRKKGERFLNRN